jgi:hypothetical protein
VKEENMPLGNSKEVEIVRRKLLINAGLMAAFPAALMVLPAACTDGTEKTAKTTSVSPGKAELELLSPMGVIDPPPMLGLSPRLKTLEGKRLAMIHNNKAGAKELLIAVEEQLKEKYPSATFVRFDTTIGLADKPEKYAEIAESCDAFILGAGDLGTCTWWGVYHSIQIEKNGKPGVFLATENLMKNAESSSSDWGMPGFRTIALPPREWYTHRGTAEEMLPTAAKLLNAIIDGLTRPLTEKEANPKQRKKEIYPPITVSADSYEAAVEKFNEVFLENHMGDGLPLLPPTAERVKWMLSGTSRGPDEVLGKCPLRFGNVTIEKVAINAVMAGAKPEYLPAIIAAMDCFVGESGPGQKGEFFFHVLTSGGSFNLMILFNGPLAKELNMNSGPGFLGHGWRANNTIGRAVRLSTITIGHCWPAENDMALTGRINPHTWITFAENETESPWEPCHVGKGFAKDDSVVTVCEISSSFSTFIAGVTASWTAMSILDQMASKMSKRGGYMAVFALEVAEELKRLGFDRKDIQEWFHQKTGVAAENVNVLVAGSVPGYCLLFRITAMNAHVSKKITGATLTKAGRA